MYTKAAQIIKNSDKTIAFTGAGISVESGIPPFRGKNGLWNKYDPATFDIQFFYDYPQKSWQVLQEIFYDLFGKVKPNTAHFVLAELEANNLLSCVITQNIDHLHYDAGNKVVHEFHGCLKKLVCMDCKAKYDFSKVDLNELPPKCIKCDGILKPDVVFFGEPIPEEASTQSTNAAQKASCVIMIGTTGTVAPANMIPGLAKSNGATIIEINPTPSEYTGSITDIFLEEQAGNAMEKLMDEIENL